jgi:uncharacterized protein YqeY
MMNMQDTINRDLITAMKAGDEVRKLTLRSVKAAITLSQKDNNDQPLSDDQIVTIIRKQAKQRQDSIAAYQQGGRADLVAAEQAELAVLESYLPALMSKEAIREHAQAVIDEVDANSMRDMGKVMGRLMPELKGKADGSLVNQVVRELLS